MTFHDIHKMAVVEVENDTCRYWKTPSMAVYLANLEPEYLGLIIFSAMVLFITSITLLTEAVFIYRRRHTWPQPAKTLWLLGLYTIFGWTAFFGILIPRSGDLGAMVATMYLAASLYIFKKLMVSYFGGATKMMERLKDSKYSLQSPPCCCCLCCLPKVPVTSKSTNWIEVCIIQFAVLQPILVFTEAVIIADMQENMNPQVTVITNGIGTVSSMVAIYGLILFFRVSNMHLAYASIKAKFVCLKLLVGIDGLQKMILSALADTKVIPCASKLSHKDNAYRISRFLMLLEASLISILARMYYKRDQNLHLYPIHRAHIEVSHEIAPPGESNGSNATTETSSILSGSADAQYGAVVENEITSKQHLLDNEVVTKQPKAEA